MVGAMTHISASIFCCRFQATQLTGKTYPKTVIYYLIHPPYQPRHFILPATSLLSDDILVERHQEQTLTLHGGPEV